MITDEDVGIHLEHYGIKGMRWGVRRDNKIPLTPQQEKERKAKRAKRVSRAIRITTTALIISAMLRGSSGSTRVRDLSDDSEEISNHITEATHRISPNAREIMRQQNIARDKQYQGAQMLKKILRDMGHDVAP